MNNLTVIDRAAVKHPEIVTIDEAQNLLDQYGIGGVAVKIPGGVDLKTFFGRCPGGLYVDDSSTSGTSGGPIVGIVYYSVINGGIPGNRSVVASSHGNDLWIAEVYGDVFRGWINFARPADVKIWIQEAIEMHEASRNHPYATEAAKGLVQLATQAQAVGGTEASAVLTVLRAQNLLDSYGLGSRSVLVPDGVNLGTWFGTQKPGFYRLGASSSYTNVPQDQAFGWAQIVTLNNNLTNSRSLLLMTDTGRMYAGVLHAGAFTGWKLKLQMEDLPLASTFIPGIVQLVDSVTSTDLTKAPTANAVKLANDNANSRVPSSRTVNGKALTADITITASDVGAWSKVEADNRYILKTEQRVPPGTPIPYGKTVAPEGFIILQGQAISQDMPLLYATYGGVLPDLRGVVLRGLDLGRGIDSGRTVLSYQDDALQNMTGEFIADISTWKNLGHVSGVFADVGPLTGADSDEGIQRNAEEIRRVQFDASRVARTAAETRMKNVAFTYITRIE